ncbi:MAG: PilN domain-containing protein [Steroidobacteraceae bacterium]
MIRINLLATERQKAARRAPAFDIGKRITLVCSLILVLGAGGIGWWYWSLTQEAAAVEADIAASQQEVVRLRPIIAEVSKFEARRQQLQQRVQLIEQLRKGQGVPVQLLDQVSRSLPDMLWLTTMTQKGNDVTIEGRSVTLVALSDFVGNLGTTDFFKKPIEIVDSQVESQTQGPETIKFTVKAQLAAAPGGAGGPAAGR